jgi:hypothetical protein
LPPRKSINDLLAAAASSNRCLDHVFREVIHSAAGSLSMDPFCTTTLHFETRFAWRRGQQHVWCTLRGLRSRNHRLELVAITGRETSRVFGAAVRDTVAQKFTDDRMIEGLIEKDQRMLAESQR